MTILFDAALLVQKIRCGRVMLNEVLNNYGVTYINHKNKFWMATLEVVVRRCSVKKLLLKLKHNSQENCSLTMLFSQHLFYLKDCKTISFPK